MLIASSACATCCEFASASLKTATVLIPRRLHVAITRHAISPRFAIRTFFSILLTHRRPRTSPFRRGQAAVCTATLEFCEST